MPTAAPAASLATTRRAHPSDPSTRAAALDELALAAQGGDPDTVARFLARLTERVRPLAQSLRLPWRAVGLDEPSRLDKVLDHVDVMLNLAGPFMMTARPALESCLRTNTHYLDVTGELAVFQDLHRYDSRARTRGIMVMPGIGFAALASDCLAAHVASRLPKAQFLRLGISRPDIFSRGTLKTMFSLVRERVSIRREGRLTSVPVGRLGGRSITGKGSE